MAQKTTRGSTIRQWERTAKRLIPQPRKRLVVVLVAALALCAVGGAVFSHGQDLQIEKSQNPQGELTNTQSEVEVNNISQPQPENDSDTGIMASNDAEQNKEIKTKGSHYCIHIDGAVVNPGVYTLTKDDARVSDAVDCAGGLLDSADTSAINLAEMLIDGAKVHIPFTGEELKPQGTAQVQEGSSSTLSSGNGGGSLSAPGASEGQPVNLNSATVEELQTLPGVGEATAKAIVEDREAHGPFASPEDLMRVSGIGEKKFAKLQDRVCV